MVETIDDYKYWHTYLAGSLSAAILVTSTAVAVRVHRAVRAAGGAQPSSKAWWLTRCLVDVLTIPLLFERLLWFIAAIYWFTVILLMAPGPYPSIAVWVCRSIYSISSDVTSLDAGLYFCYWFLFSLISEGTTMFMLQPDTSACSIALSMTLSTVVAGLGSAIATIGFMKPSAQSSVCDPLFNAVCGSVHVFALCTQLRPAWRARFRSTVLWSAAFGTAWRAIYIVYSLQGLFTTRWGEAGLLLRCVGVPLVSYVGFLADVQYWNARARAVTKMARVGGALGASPARVAPEDGGRGGASAPLLSVGGDADGTLVFTAHTTGSGVSTSSPLTITGGYGADTAGCGVHAFPEEPDCGGPLMLELVSPSIASVLQPPNPCVQSMLTCLGAPNMPTSLGLHMRRRFERYRRELHARARIHSDGSDVQIPEEEVTIVSQPIASGSYGEVCAGRWRGSAVAIKTFHSDARSLNADAFNRERAGYLSVRDPSNRNHPALVGYLGFVVCLDRLSMVFELAEYGSLDRVLETAREMAPNPLTPLRRLRMMADIAAGLAHMHDVGALHRDMKPMNVLVCRE